MEISCSRCHQTVEAGDTFCPICGLPQLVYSADATNIAEQPERWPQAVRDANSVDWTPALKTCLALAIPAGMFCSLLSPLGISGLLLIGGAGAWAVALYMRGQKPAWITLGAGARIGLVTGLLGGWAAIATTGISLFGLRYWFHEGNSFDSYWQNLVVQQMSQQWTNMGVDVQTIALAKGWMLSPEGRAGWILSAVVFLATAVLVFGAAGGALGARFLGRPRRKQS
jgi:hypothetical protein